MRSSLVPLSGLFALMSIGCDSPAPDVAKVPAIPEAPAKQAVVAPTDHSDARMALLRAQMDDSREIARAYAAGELGDRLVAGGMLLVDAKASTDADQSQFFVFDGVLAAPPGLLSALKETKAADGSSPKQILLGGEDSSRPAVFRGITPGTYTACAVVGPPKSAAKAAYLARAEAVYKAENGEKLDADKLASVAAKVQAETGYVPETIDWGSVPVRCKQVVVTDDAASRVVVLDRS